MKFMVQSSTTPQVRVGYIFKKMDFYSKKDGGRKVTKMTDTDKEVIKMRQLSLYLS